MFQERLAASRDYVEKRLLNELKAYSNVPVVEAMRYSLKGGKGLRAFLVMESARLHDVKKERAVFAAAAIEAIHAYSLIHDDLPCMDDDDLRRGQPTVHKKWDEATAVLAGDALQTFAFDLLTRPENGPADRRLALIKSLAKAAGAKGMVLGQAQDIAAETAAVPLNESQIVELQKNKTGALIQWSAMAGARIAYAESRHLKKYAKALGLAFQIWDDVLDIEGDANIVGKAVGKDADAGKATFVSILGLDGAKSRAKELVEEACDALNHYGYNAEALREAARFVIQRDR